MNRELVAPDLWHVARQLAVFAIEIHKIGGDVIANTKYWLTGIATDWLTGIATENATMVMAN